MKKFNVLLTIVVVLTLLVSGGFLYIIFFMGEDTLQEEIPEVIEYDLSINEDLYPMYPIGDTIPLFINEVDLSTINFVSSNPNVIEIVNNEIIAKAKGETVLTFGDIENPTSVNIKVTDLYTLPDYHSENKPYLTETICDEQEAHLLDDVLARKIDEAGYKTRAGVVAAARFIALEFPYKLAYFSESGRLDITTGTAFADGEGRYYHTGLYLSEDKFDSIEASIYGPAYWGQFFEEDDSDDHSKDEYYLGDGFTTADIGTHLYLSKRPNGFDCSGYVSWCYLNGGYDFGDMGAGGPDSYGMTILGDLEYIDNELLQSDKIKAGDLVGYPGHIGIVIGVESNYIWIADTLISGTKVVRYERNKESFDALGEDAFLYFMLMDSEYIDDGNYTPMWN